MHLTGMAGRNDPARPRSLQNRSKSLLLGCLAAVALSAPANAQTKTFTWVSGMCTGTLRYDPKKLDVKALDATTRLLDPEAGFPIPPQIATPADIAKIDIAAFERECAGDLDKLRQTTLPIDGIEEYRALRVRHVQDACAFGVALLRGYSDPKALRTYTPASPLCDRFVDPIEGKSDLNSAWKRAVDEGCADNASPQRCKARYEAEAARPDGAARKRLYLTTFGWNNCATNSIAYNTDAGTTARQALQGKLSKAFARTYRAKFVCEEEP
jgi:hypothetical protein